MNARLSRQPAQEIERDEESPEADWMFGDSRPDCGDKEFADANSGLIDELEQILRGGADPAPEPVSEDPLPSFPLAQPAPPEEPPALAELGSHLDPWEADPWEKALALANDAILDDEDDVEADDLDTAITPVSFDEPELSPEPGDDIAGAPRTRYGSPDAPFWESTDFDEEPRRPVLPGRTPLVQRRDIAIIALLVALIAAGATYSAIQLTRDPVVVATTDPTATVDADELAAADPEAGGDPLQPVVVEAEIAPSIAEEVPFELASDTPTEPADSNGSIGLTPAEIAAVSSRVTNPPAEDEADPATPPRNAIAAEEAGNSPVMAFAGAGGPFVADPLQTLSGIPPGSNTPGSNAPTTPAVANSYVNMRAGPDNAAAIITVVAAGTDIDVIECNFWCEVIVNGQEGWIYQDFLDLQP